MHLHIFRLPLLAMILLRLYFRCYVTPLSERSERKMSLETEIKTLTHTHKQTKRRSSGFCRCQVSDGLDGCVAVWERDLSSLSLSLARSLARSLLLHILHFRMESKLITRRSLISKKKKPIFDGNTGNTCSAPHQSLRR